MPSRLLRFRWPAVVLLSLLLLALVLQDPRQALRPVLFGSLIGLGLTALLLRFRLRQARSHLLQAETLWQQGAAAAVAEKLAPYRAVGGEVGYRVGNLLGYAHLDLGWKQTAWVDFLEAQLCRAPWWVRFRVSSFLTRLPEQPTAQDLRRGQRLIQACPGVPRLPHAVGILHLRLKEPEAAWNAFRSALPQAAEDPLLLEDLFLASLENPAHRDVTETALARLMDRHGDPRISWDRGTAGRFLIGQGRSVEAVALLRRVPATARTSPWHWAALAMGLHALGDLEAARAEVEQGLQHHPRAFLLWMERFRLALDAHDDGAAEGSLAEAAHCLPDEPALRWEWNLRNAEFQYWVRGDAEAAQAFLDEVPTNLQQEGHPPLRLHLQIATGDFEGAQRALQPLLSQHPEDLDLRLLQADVLAGREAWKDLLPYLEALPTEARSRAVFWHLRGLALVNLGDAFHSRFDLERAAHMEPTTLRFVLDAGHGCAELGEWERSETHWRQALRLEPTLEEALVQLAEARRVLHDLPGARQLLRECLTHHPHSEEAQVRLAELEIN